MKPLFISLLYSFLKISAFAQNVGIGKTNPQAKLEIKHTNNTEPSLMVSDSVDDKAGQLRFRSLLPQYNNRLWDILFKAGSFSKNNEISIVNDSTNVMYLYGSGNVVIGDGVNPDARLSILSDNPAADILNVMGETQTPALKINASRNVGINNPTPSERLDVNGNINITGTIKANGIDGTSNQVLMKNNAGVLIWGDMCEYKNYRTYMFTTIGSVQTFVVPADVTKVKIQAWGGGGKGLEFNSGNSRAGGGGGGGYIEGYITVTPGSTINIQVGSGASTSNASTQSRVDYNPSISFIAMGGGDAFLNTTFNQLLTGAGGGFFTLGTQNYYGTTGEAGTASQLRYDQISATEFGRVRWGAEGGNAGNSVNTGGKGNTTYLNTTLGTTLVDIQGATNGRIPGGGSADTNASGGNGIVIIHY